MVVLTPVEGPANVVTPSPNRTLANDGLAMEYETREAGGRLLATTERDLQRIVLDMHDGPVQALFAALSQLPLLERALGEIRSFIGAFRPPGFERRSLVALIEGLAVQHETLTGQGVELALPGALGD